MERHTQCTASSGIKPCRASFSRRAGSLAIQMMRASEAGGNVAERKYHGITWSCLPGPCDRQSARVHMDRCVITIRYAQIPGKELATAEFVR